MPSTATDKNHDVAALKAVSDNLRGRRTIALFEPHPVEEQLILEAIELARWAPNHHVTQPWHFYLLGDEAREATLHWVEVIVGERASPEVGARKRAKWADVPGWVVVTCKLSDDALMQQEDYAACACALHSFSLYLWQRGIGMKWSTGSITRDPRYLDALGIDQDKEIVVGLVSYGYPKTVPVQKRHEVEQLVTRLP